MYIFIIIFNEQNENIYHKWKYLSCGTGFFFLNTFANLTLIKRLCVFFLVRKTLKDTCNKEKLIFKKSRQKNFENLLFFLEIFYKIEVDVPSSDFSPSLFDLEHDCLVAFLAPFHEADWRLAVWSSASLRETGLEKRVIPGDLVACARFEQEAGTRWPRAKMVRCRFEMDFAAKNDRSSANARGRPERTRD